MLQIPDEAVGSTRGEGQRVSPKVPLERHDERGSNTGPDQRQSRLASCQAGVEESQTRDHDQHHRRSDDDVALVTLGVPLIEILGSWGTSEGGVHSQRTGEKDEPELPPVKGFVPLNSAGAPIHECDIVQ